MRGRLDNPEIVDGAMYCPNYPKCPGVIDLKDKKNGRKHTCNLCGTIVHVYRRGKKFFPKITFCLHSLSKKRE